MPRRIAFSAREVQGLREIVWEVGLCGPFALADVLFAVLPTGLTCNARLVEELVEDLVDVGFLWIVEGQPPRWALAIDE